jgi:hypothetical protein
MATLAWRKSSYSENGANCVEVAPTATGFLLRDTKDRGTGPVVAFTPDQWTAFLAEVTRGIPSTDGAVTVIVGDRGVQVRALATGIRLTFTPSEWSAFRAGVQDGEFELMALA